MRWHGAKLDAERGMSCVSALRVGIVLVYLRILREDVIWDSLFDLVCNTNGRLSCH